MEFKYCANCKRVLQDGDKYCRYCGRSRNETEYQPDYGTMLSIYGPPPVKRKHKCSSCGFAWTTFEMLDEQKYCPQCGSDAPEIKDDDDSTLLPPPPNDGFVLIP